MPKMLFQGHASLRFVTDAGTVIYVDPYRGEGYDLPADILLVSHRHSDHNQVGLVTQKSGCLVVTEREALAGGRYNSFEKDGVRVEAVPAANKNHPIDACVGFLLRFDGLTVYHAGDTSWLDSMPELKGRAIDYALLPIDGVYNMDAGEAARCAEAIGARFNIPIHTDPDDESGIHRQKAAAFAPSGRLVMEHGEEIELSR